MSSTVPRSCFLVLLSFLGIAQTTPVELNATGNLSNTDWQLIREEHERHRYTPVISGTGYRALNLQQQWTTEFDGRGFLIEPNNRSWNWGLQLRSYGIGGREQSCRATPRVRTTSQRLIYEWNDALEEWFINDHRGLEHGFTLRTRPPGTGSALSFRLSVRGGLRPVVSQDGQAVGFADDAGNNQLTYAGLKVWDAKARSLPATFRSEADDTLLLEIDVTGASYPVTIDPIAQQAYLKASNTGPGDMFGWSAALYGDTLVVGAPREDSSAIGVNGDQANNAANDSGAAYVFVRNAGTWTQQAYLKASNSGAGDLFGYSVAIIDDTIVVGAPMEASTSVGVNGFQLNNDAFGSGAAYVFTRNGSVWSQQAYLKPSNTRTLQAFGHAVSISGNSIVVGSPQEGGSSTGVNGNQTTFNAAQSGAAYVFVRDGSTWTQQAYLKASNTEPMDHFGEDVAISGNSIAVGTPYEDSPATGINGSQGNGLFDAGAVYVFVRNGNQWSQEAYVKASNTGITDFFGYRLALSGNTLVCGAPQEDSSASGVNGDQNNNATNDSGAAYVFQRIGTVWSQQAYLKASNPGVQDYFGGSAALSGDTIVIGAEDEDSNATGVNGNQNDNSITGSGAAYVFARSGGQWSQQAYLKASNPGVDDEFGWTVAVSGDTIVATASGERSNATGVNGNQADNSAPSAGAVYVFANPFTPVALRFVPMTPCRLVETRPLYAGSLSGAFGPPALAARTARTIPVAASTACSIPSTAKAYVFNVTLDTFYDQTGPVDFLSIWPSGEPRPDFYTVRTTTGGYIANAAIVKAGTNGSVDVYASHATNLVLDISGYFTDDPAAPGLLYYPINPCRAVDTRGPIYSTLPPPYGNQRMQARDTRTFHIPGSPGCSIPAAAAYSLQLTLAPGELTNGDPVAFLTAYPTGVPRPNISNMNAFFGYVSANSAIVPASQNGSIDVFALDATNVIIDVNGYFAADDGTGRGLYYYPTTQCRVMNTQDPAFTGPFGAPAMSPAADRSVPVPTGRCTGLPTTAKAWALNAWVVPLEGMPFLSMWPTGSPWGIVSQLNAFQGQTVANSGIVPASTSGSIDIKVAGSTHVGLEVSGYFSRN